MDSQTFPAKPSCPDFPYSEDYVSFVIRYDSDINGVTEGLAPDCVIPLDNRFLVAYRNAAFLPYDTVGKSLNILYPKCYALADTSAVASTGVTRLRTLPGLGLTGSGVLIGFADTGIDYTNPLFQTIFGTTRIAAVWDQTIPPESNTVSVFGYGTEYTEEQINTALASDNPYSVVPTKDQNGHGTFLASVACGRFLPEVPFTGMAPDAELLVVKLKSAKQNLRSFYGIPKDAECYGEDDILLAVNYMLAKAQSLGKPLVICLGLGTNQGDHNGSTVLEQYLSVLANRRGLCVTAPAGNELGFGTHFQSAPSEAATFSSRRPASFTTSVEINVNTEAGMGNAAVSFSLEIWGRSPDLPRLTVISPSGERNAAVPYVRAENTTLSFLFEGTTVYIETMPTEIATGSPMYFIRFENAVSGIWTLEVVHSLTIDAWLPVREFLPGDIFFVRPNPDTTVTSPGNGYGVVTAAGCDHTNDALYENSGRGYTRLMRIKPDLAAPAVDVFGAFAASASASKPLFSRRSGTSVAAAITAGAAAILLEWGYINGNNPAISTLSVREYLIRGTKIPPNRAIPDRGFGFGILDLYGTFEQFRSGR